jgi:hypothetical protein
MRAILVHGDADVGIRKKSTGSASFVRESDAQLV